MADRDSDFLYYYRSVGRLYCARRNAPIVELDQFDSPASDAALAVDRLDGRPSAMSHLFAHRSQRAGHRPNDSDLDCASLAERDVWHRHEEESGDCCGAKEPSADRAHR